MRLTANYGLKMPEGTDVVNVDDFNGNLATIDTKLKELETNETFYAVATGSANTYSISISALSTLSTYYDGLSVCAKINIDCTGASTLNVNGWGDIPILDSLGNPITSGGLKANTPYPFRYESTRKAFILVLKGGGGNLTADKLLTGYSGTGDTGLVNGTMPNNGAINITPGATAKAIPTGYTSGGTVAGDPNLISSNIKAGKAIFGVSGSSTVVDTADAVLDPQYLLSGYSGYDDGVKKAGTMTNRGNTKFQISGYEGITELIPHPSAPTTQGLITCKNMYNQTGYIDGNSQIQFSVNNLVPSNIVSGVSIGLYNGSGSQVMVGTATIESLGGRRYASGYATNSSGGITVNLGFTPTVVIAICDNGDRYVVSSINTIHVAMRGTSYDGGAGSTLGTTFTVKFESASYGSNATWYAWA